MALINCPDCGQSVSTKAKQCVACGRPLIISGGQEWSEVTQGKKLVLYALATLVLVLTGWGVAWAVKAGFIWIGIAYATPEWFYWTIWAWVVFSGGKSAFGSFERGDGNN